MEIKTLLLSEVVVKIKRFIICEGLRKVPGTQSLRKIFVKIFKNFRDFSGGPGR